MSDTAASLRKTIANAAELRTVVRTMKATAAAGIGQFERSVSALNDYYRTIELGLQVCLRHKSGGSSDSTSKYRADPPGIVAIVFGSDQGLVGRFNDVAAEFAIEGLRRLPGQPQVFAVGERVYARLQEADLDLQGPFPTPTSVQAIAPLVGQLQIEADRRLDGGAHGSVYVYHNRPRADTLYEPVSQRLLPLDAEWEKGLSRAPWPTNNLAEVIGTLPMTLREFVGEYLFISLFRACAESLASENASRLAAMRRAEKNIGELLEELQGKFRRTRQASIDEELFDVVAGFEAQQSSEVPNLRRR